MTLAVPHPSWRRLEPLAAHWRTRRQLELLGPRPHRDPCEFAILGDVEPCRFRLLRLVFNRPRVFARQLLAIQEGPAAFCVQLGDMVGRGSPRFYARFLEELGGLGVKKPYLTVIGNHDRSQPNGPSDSALYRHLFGPCNYAFDFGPARFVMLDTSFHRLRRAQLRWLERVLETHRRKIIFTHMGPVQLGLWGGSVAHAHGGFSRGAREFTELVSSMNVDRVYLGHVHAFGVQDYLGVRYVLTGGGGSALFPVGAPDRFHHYLMVSVDQRGIRERVHPLEGRPFEVPPGTVLLPPVEPTWPARVAHRARRLVNGGI